MRRKNLASLSTSKRLVVKIGSALLVDKDSGKLRSLLKSYEDVAAIRKVGTDVVIVSSGSCNWPAGVGSGTSDLLFGKSCCRGGWSDHLARAYEDALAPHQITTAQVPVTLEDSADRRRYLNSTLETLLSLGVTPIVNENDTIATDEIRYGDNTAGRAVRTIGADCLVLLSDVDGLYTANPQVMRMLSIG